MPTPYSVVDAFTDRPFGGNPAAVVRLDAPAEPAWMQAVAREMNLSETAFLTPGDDAGQHGLRWFTPAVEVDLCGHATLASAHVLWDEGGADRTRPLRFETRSGTLVASLSDGQVWLDFPALPPEATAPPDGLVAALGLEPGHVRATARSRFDWLVEVAGDADLAAIRPDLARLAAVEARGVIVTCRAAGRDAADGLDFLSRFFAPRAGVPEDPVTGSAHCVLAPYWAAQLGRAAMRGYQASQRPGVVAVRLDGDRVHLGGRAATVMRGTIGPSPRPVSDSG